LPDRWADVVVAELARGVLGSWHDHDLATLLAVYADHAVIDMSGWAGWPDQSIYQGPEGMRRFFVDWDSAWSEFGFQPTRLLRLDPERYLVEIEFEGHGATSGIEVRRRFFQVAQASKGFVTRMANYTEEREALEAAGVGG
jgi:SnoaL-like domain